VSGEKKEKSFRHEGGEKMVQSPLFKGGIAMRISRRESK